MRFSDIIVVVHRQADVQAVVDAGAVAGWRKVIPHVLGAPGAPTPVQLRRVRRSPDLRKRRLPVLVFTVSNEEETTWKDAGAYIARGKVTLAAAEKILREIAGCGDDWVESSVYIGPDRRRKRGWLTRPSRPRRLADEAVLEKQAKAMADDSSFATHMRQLRHTAFGCDKADRTHRAQLLADVMRTKKAAERARMMHAVAAMESLARLMRASGAVGKLNEELVEKHIDVAEGPAVDAEYALPRIVTAVDAAIGLNSAA
jgi:hypothetical protein